MASGDVSPQPELSIELVAAVTGYTDTPAGHATYAVSCKVSAEGAGRWRSSVLVERRFKEFDKLHSALAPRIATTCRLLTCYAGISTVPSFSCCTVGSQSRGHAADGSSVPVSRIACRVATIAAL